MKKLLLIIISAVMALSVNAQQFKWKEVKSSMTTVPEDYYDGTTKSDAKAKMDDDFLAEGAVFGAQEEGLFNAIHWDDDWENIVEEKISWETIVESGLMYYYPAALGTSQEALELDENSETSLNELFEDGDSYSKVTLTRKMTPYLSDGTTRKWHTVVLPFAMTMEQVEETFGFYAKLMKYVDEEDIILKFESATSIEYGGFYLLQLGTDVDEVSKIEVEGNITMSTLYSHYGFDYTLVAVKEVTYVDNIMSYNYAVVDNNLKSTEDEVKLTATQWYVSDEWGESVKDLKISMDGVVTSVESLQLNNDGQFSKKLEGHKIIITDGNSTYSSQGIEIR